MYYSFVYYIIIIKIFQGRTGVVFNVIVWVRSQVCRHSPPHGYEIMIELRIRNVITYTFMSIIIMYVCNLTNKCEINGLYFWGK